jgi:hypothetical protein
MPIYKNLKEIRETDWEYDVIPSALKKLDQELKSKDLLPEDIKESAYLRELKKLLVKEKKDVAGTIESLQGLISEIDLIIGEDE